MSDFNLGSPDKRGMEWLAAYARGISLAGANRQAIGGRFRADTTTAMTHVHPYLLTVTSRSGLQFEIYDDQDAVPLQAPTDVYATSDSYATYTGWTRWPDTSQGYWDSLNVISGTPDRLLYNTSALGSTSYLNAWFQMAGTTLTAATRVLSIELWAYVAIQSAGAYATNTAIRVPMTGHLGLGTVDYTIGSTMVPRDGRWSLRQIGYAPLDPSTGLPWTIATVNQLITVANDNYQPGWMVGPGGKLGANAFQIGGFVMRIRTVTENRYGYYYTPETPIRGISRQGLSGTRSLKVGDWYRWLLAPLSGEPNSRVTTSALRAPQPVVAATPADVFEQRLSYDITLTGVGGVPQQSIPHPGEIVPLLLEDVSGIRSQSSPYASMFGVTLANVVYGLELEGTTSYATLPDLSKLRVSTAAGIKLWVSATGWAPASDQCIFSKSGAAGNRGLEVWLLTTGVLRLKVSEDGTAQTSYDSTVATGLTNGTGKNIKITFAANSATGVNFYTADDDATWTQLGAAVSTSGFTDIYASTAPVELGSVNGGGSLFDGRIYYAQLFADVLCQDARLQVGFTLDGNYPATTTTRPGDATIVAKTGGTVTLAGAATLTRRVLAQSWTSAAGTNTYGQVVVAAAWAAGISPNAPLDVQIRSGVGAAEGKGTLEAYAQLTQQAYKAAGGTGPPLTVRLPLYDNSGVRTWEPSAGTQYAICLSSSASANRGWSVAVVDSLSTDTNVPKTTTTQANIEAATHGGTTDVAFFSGTPTARYDVPVYLVAAPVAPTASVSVKEAT